jgi:hypothetical protein
MMVHRMLVPPVCAVAVFITAMIPYPAAAQVTQPIVRVTDIVVDSVVAEAGQLIAIADVTLDVLGRTVTQNDVEIPLTLGGTAAEPCDILNLALGPIDLNLLGLVVELDDCANGPVTVDITGVPGDLLGDLLCSIAGLLDGGIDLGDILGGLPADDLAGLLDGIRGVLNDIFADLLGGGAAAAAHGHVIAQQQGGGGGHRCDILNLEIENGITLDLLGLLVETSPICLDVYAERGSGNLLGNLLCGLTGLLDTSANNNALQAQVRNILRLLDRLGL